MATGDDAAERTRESLRLNCPQEVSTESVVLESSLTVYCNTHATLTFLICLTDSQAIIQQMPLVVIIYGYDYIYANMCEMLIRLIIVRTRST